MFLEFQFGRSHPATICNTLHGDSRLEDVDADSVANVVRSHLRR